MRSTKTNKIIRSKEKPTQIHTSSLSWPHWSRPFHHPHNTPFQLPSSHLFAHLSTKTPHTLPSHGYGRKSKLFSVLEILLSVKPERLISVSWIPSSPKTSVWSHRSTMVRRTPNYHSTSFPVFPYNQISTRRQVNPHKGSIGFATAATLGVEVARREQSAAQQQNSPNSAPIVSFPQQGRTILCTGDGSMALTIQEIGTMIHAGIAPIIIVINNAGYTIERSIWGAKQRMFPSLLALFFFDNFSCCSLLHLFPLASISLVFFQSSFPLFRFQESITITPTFFPISLLSGSISPCPIALPHHNPKTPSSTLLTFHQTAYNDIAPTAYQHLLPLFHHPSPSTSFHRATTKEELTAILSKPSVQNPQSLQLIELVMEKLDLSWRLGGVLAWRSAEHGEWLKSEGFVDTYGGWGLDGAERGSVKWS